MYLRETRLTYTAFAFLLASCFGSSNCSDADIPTRYSDLSKCLLVLNSVSTQSVLHASDLSNCEQSDHWSFCESSRHTACDRWLTKIYQIFSSDCLITSVRHTATEITKPSWLVESLRLLNTGIHSECSIFVYKKPVIDRTCLLSPLPKHPETPAIIDVATSANSLQSLVDQLNKLCDTYRSVDGLVNTQGLHRDYILANLFSVRHLPNYIKSINAFDGMRNSKSNSLPMCEKVSIDSWTQFFTDYLQISKPVIITNAMSFWNASTRWTNKYLKTKYGNKSVHIKLSPTTDYEGIESSALWTGMKSGFEIPELVLSKLKFPDLVVPRPATANMNFSSYINLMEAISDRVIANASAYLEYSSIRQYFPDLEDDISEMPFINSNLKLNHLNMWLSDGNTLGKLHFDPFDNFLCMIDGKKELTLFEPHNNDMLYEAHIPEAQFTVDLKTYTFQREDLLESTSMVMSPFDIRKPDFTRFPKFKDTMPLNCTIEEGEVLFMPAFWWHEVQSYPNVAKKRNLAVNYWYEPFLSKEFPCPQCPLGVNSFYRHLL